MTSLLFFCAVVLWGCEQKTEFSKHHFDGAIMGTTYNVTVVVKNDAGIPQDLAQNIEQVLQAVDMAMSTYKPESELSRLNANATDDWIELSPELFFVMQQAQWVAKETEGAFDVTVGPLVDLWGFGPEETQDTVPSPEQIAAAKQKIGYQHLQMQEAPPALKKNSGVHIDLSAIAKGYGVDQVAKHLDAVGIDNYLVEVGGELVAKGHNAQRENWRIGIEKPSMGHEGVLQKLVLINKAVATSGDYRNYFEKNGVRYSHTIDPASGRPINHSLASVTVIANTATQADAWATAFDVVGLERAKSLADKHQLAAYFIYKDGESFRTEATSLMEQYLIH